MRERNHCGVNIKKERCHNTHACDMMDGELMSYVVIVKMMLIWVKGRFLGISKFLKMGKD